MLAHLLSHSYGLDDEHDGTPVPRLIRRQSSSRVPLKSLQACDVASHFWVTLESIYVYSLVPHQRRAEDISQRTEADFGLASYDVGLLFVLYSLTSLENRVGRMDHPESTPLTYIKASHLVISDAASLAGVWTEWPVPNQCLTCFGREDAFVGPSA